MSKMIKTLLVLTLITGTCWAYLLGGYMGSFVIGEGSYDVSSGTWSGGGGTAVSVDTSSTTTTSSPTTTSGSSSSVNTSTTTSSGGSSSSAPAVDTSSVDLGFFDDGNAGENVTAQSDSETGDSGSSTETATATPLPVMSGYEQANFDATVAQLEQNYGLDSGEAKEVAAVYYFGGDNEDDWLGDSSCPAMSGDLAPIIQDVTGEPAMDAYGTAAYEQDIIHYSQRYGVSEDQAKQAIDLYLSGHISGDMWIEKDPVDGEFKEDYLEVGPETGVGYPICPIMSNDIEPYLNYVIGAGPKPATPTSEDIEKIQLGQLGSSTKPDVVTIGGKTNEIISLSAGNTPEDKEKVYSALTLAAYDKSGVTYSNGSGAATNGSSSTPTYSSSTTPTYDGGSSIPTYSGSGSTYDRKSGSSYKKLIENINTDDIREYSGIISEVGGEYRIGTSDAASVLTRHIADRRTINPDYRISRDDNIIGSIRENRNTSNLIEAVRETKTGGVAAVAADLNCDGKVNLADFGILLSFWNKDPSGANSCKSPDINQDGAVNLSDFSVMMSYWNYEGQGQSSYEGQGQSNYEGRSSYDNWRPSQSGQESYEERRQRQEALQRWDEQRIQEGRQKRERDKGLPY